MERSDTTDLDPCSRNLNALIPACSGGPAESLGDADGVILDQVLLLFSEVAGRPASRADADTPFVELGVDSLALAELAAELEMHFGIRIEDKEFAALGCFRDAARHVAGLRSERDR